MSDRESPECYKGTSWAVQQHVKEWPGWIEPQRGPWCSPVGVGIQGQTPMCGLKAKWGHQSRWEMVETQEVTATCREEAAPAWR